MNQIFKNRVEAGKLLAEKFQKYKGQDAIVLALPRGGVPVGYEIAKSLGVPLGVIVVRKLGAPSNPEFGFGAVGQGGLVVVDPYSVSALGLTDDDIKTIASREAIEMERRIKLFQKNEPEVKDKIAIIVDDGLATGMTALAAIRSLKTREPKKIVLATPVCAKQTTEYLRKEVDELVCLQEPEDLAAVGNWYQDFPQLTDQEVVEILNSSRRS